MNFYWRRTPIQIRIFLHYAGNVIEAPYEICLRERPDRKSPQDGQHDVHRQGVSHSRIVCSRVCQDHQEGSGEKEDSGECQLVSDRCAATECNPANAFSSRDKDFLEDCANVTLALWTESPK
jgi:hypothetical protein